MSDVKLEDLVKKRDLFVRKITKIQTTVLNFTNSVTQSEVELASVGIQEIKSKVDELYEATHQLVSSDEFTDDHETDFDTLFASIQVIQIKTMNLEKKLTKNQKRFESPSFKLDRIKLPQFSGAFSDWQSFHDLFKVSVDQNTTLSGTEKLIHLKSCLTGEAANIISTFSATDANYLEAWNSVQRRYSNKREIVFAHIKKFDEISPIQFESSSGLRLIADAINELTRSLKVLSIPVEHWDLIIIFMSVKKIDSITKREWLLRQKSDLPSLKFFLEFLETRSRALVDAIVLPSVTKSTSSSRSLEKGQKTSSSFHHSSSEESSSSIKACLKCGESHHLFQCKSFSSLSVMERNNFVKKNLLCFNCLFKGHGVSKCKINLNCKKCGKRHHTLIHLDTNQSSSSSSSTIKVKSNGEKSDEITTSVSSNFSTHKSNNLILMGTMLVHVCDSKGEKQNCRIFLDSGSESHFISENCVDRLGLTRKKTCVTVTGISGLVGESANGIVNVRLFSKVREFSLSIQPLILKKITGLLPRVPCKGNWQHLAGLELADPQFHHPSSIDILLGAEYAASIMIPGIRRGQTNSPVAQNSQFGWILSGPVNTKPSDSFQVSSHHSICKVNESCLQSSLSKFWDLEEPEIYQGHLTEEDLECENHFLSTHKKRLDGSFEVELPIKTHAPSIGLSRDIAFKRLQAVERRLSLHPETKQAYIEAMEETLSQFAEKVPDEEIKNKGFYMPHHVVVKELNTSTKHRVVFDASAKSSNGISLNDILMTGEKLQVDLIPLLIRFRSHRVAMSADIVKFFNQFWINSKHVDYQRLLWRSSPDDPIQDYRMLRLSFGLTCSPFLATRCLYQLAENEKLSFPKAAEMIREDFLVDNLLSGASTLEEAISNQQEIIQVMNNGNLKLRKWSSNQPALLSAVPVEDHETNQPLLITGEMSIRTIGFLWYPSSDTFGLTISVPSTQIITKRKVLSSIAKVFDPLGWISPFTVKLKVLMQDLWRENLDWDTRLSNSHQKQWISFCKEFEILKSLKIPRCLVSSILSQNSSFELHGFSDASQSAYAACVYFRTIEVNGDSKSILIASKTKVAPIKFETIPRLELCGAHLLVKLIETIRKALKIVFSAIKCWTDSTIVLGWLASQEKLPVFVSNRVRKINSKISYHNWFHVPGEQNPADVASRGTNAASLLENQVWFHGPPWLSSCQILNEVCSMTVEEMNHPFSHLINGCSSFSKMRRVVAYCLRFISNIKKGLDQRSLGNLTTLNLSQAETEIVRCVQSEAFKDEIRHCSKQTIVKSSLKFLTPLIDELGILRVGGRLNLSAIPNSEKHPILLPKSHNFTDVLVRYFHLTNLHAGPQLLLALLREKFWIISGSSVVKKCVRRCVICHRHHPVTQDQIMSQLPSPRVTPSKPFSHCGIDYAGPFMLCVRPGRNPRVIKSYVSLFVCMCTRAIHLELVGDLSTPSFLGALNRFISRRGSPINIYCDGGTNFVGAAKEIGEINKFLKSKSHLNLVYSFFSEKGINFHFNPPHAPHHGGLWEAGVKSMKFHLKRIVEGRKLSVEEFTTLLCQVEATLNSRPLTQMSSDPNDYAVLTPGHFLVGESLLSLPQHDITQIKVNRLTRWQLVQQMSQHFWRRWTTEYLKSLQFRPKWYTPQPNLEKGVLVLICDDDPHWGPLKWKLGRISEVYPGPDGKVRVCDVKATNGSIYRRPIVKLSPLPIY